MQATVITLGFLACNLAFFTYYLLVALYPGFPFNERTYLTLVWLMYFNSTLNPVLYILINKQIQRASIKAVSCCLYRASVVQEAIEMRSINSYTVNQGDTDRAAN